MLAVFVNPVPKSKPPLEAKGLLTGLVAGKELPKKSNAPPVAPPNAAPVKTLLAKFPPSIPDLAAPVTPPAKAPVAAPPKPAAAPKPPVIIPNPA